MKLRKVISDRIDDAEKGVAGAVNAVIAANINEPGAQHVSSKQRVRVVQRGGKTEVFEHESESSTDERRGGSDD